MIKAHLYFENGINVSALVRDLQRLPDPIAPLYFTEDEGKIIKKNVLSNWSRFSDFLKENTLGFILYAENKAFSFDISTRSVGYDEILLYLEDQSSHGLIPTFFRTLAGQEPVFGFACDEKEYDHRNRHYKTIGPNHIEAWIGRRLEKYISGVYWYTLLSDKLLSQHHVNLSELASEAISNEASGNGSVHLLRFFEEPEDWQQNVGRLDDLCKRVDGVFSRYTVDAAMTGVTTLSEYDEALAQWQ